MNNTKNTIKNSNELLEYDDSFLFFDEKTNIKENRKLYTCFMSFLNKSQNQLINKLYNVMTLPIILFIAVVFYRAVISDSTALLYLQFGISVLLFSMTVFFFTTFYKNKNLNFSIYRSIFSYKNNYIFYTLSLLAMITIIFNLFLSIGTIYENISIFLFISSYMIIDPFIDIQKYHKKLKTKVKNPNEKITNESYVLTNNNVYLLNDSIIKNEDDMEKIYLSVTKL